MDKEVKEIDTLSLEKNLKMTFSSMNRVIKQQKASLYIQEIGIVSSVGKGIVTAKGLPEVRAGEIVIFKDRQRGMIFNLEPVSYTHLRAHETRHDLVCRLLLEKKKKK